MSDIKHLEYCVKLGNELVKNKLDMISSGNYQESPIEYNNKKENDNYYNDGNNNSNSSNNYFKQDYYHTKSTTRDIEAFKARLKFELK